MGFPEAAGEFSEWAVDVIEDADEIEKGRLEQRARRRLEVHEHSVSERGHVGAERGRASYGRALCTRVEAQGEGTNPRAAVPPAS